MTAQDYPVTTPFGMVDGYPLNNGFHNGIDYGCPTGTPVVVNGVTIGLSGATGYAIGPHLHVGRWVGGSVTNPGKGGFYFQSAVVTEINQDATNGKYVRVQGDGASWVYLHMSDNSKVKVGQILQGGTVSDAEVLANLREGWLTDIGKEVSVGGPIDGNNINQIISNIRTLYKLVDEKDAEIAKLQQGGSTGTVLAPGEYIVKG